METTKHEVLSSLSSHGVQSLLRVCLNHFESRFAESSRSSWRSRTTLVPTLMDGVVNLWRMCPQAWRAGKMFLSLFLRISWVVRMFLHVFSGVHTRVMAPEFLEVIGHPRVPPYIARPQDHEVASWHFPCGFYDHGADDWEATGQEPHHLQLLGRHEHSPDERKACTRQVTVETGTTKGNWNGRTAKVMASQIETSHKNSYCTEEN